MKPPSSLGDARILSPGTPVKVRWWSLTPFNRYPFRVWVGNDLGGCSE
nr:MAG TPA: hypothetical protein [Caudoviricetes sp.]